MNYKKTTITIILLLFILGGISAQEKTAYQTKIFEIKKEYVKKILISQGKWSEKAKQELNYSSEDKVEAMLTLGLITSPNLLKNIDNDFIKAEKLKTSVDLKREKEEKIRNEKAQKEALIREKEKEIYAENRRKEEELRAELDKYERTDIGSINKSIKLKFQKWNKKGEFEKDADYIKRLQSRSIKAFNEICLKIIKDKVNDYGNYGEIDFKILTYNSEGEYFPIIFELNNIKSQGKLKISIDKASEFKSNLEMKKRQKSIYVNVNEFDWVSIGNSFFPTKVTVVHRFESKYQIPIKLNQGTEISCDFNKLEIKNEYLKGYIFKYSKSNEFKDPKEEEKNEEIELFGEEFYKSTGYRPKEQIGFNRIEKSPVFPGCEGNNDELKKCFNEKIQQYFTSNYGVGGYSEIQSHWSYKIKLSIGFVITTNGDIKNIMYGYKNSQGERQRVSSNLEKEFKRIITGGLGSQEHGLPKIKSGEHLGTKVDTKYITSFYCK